MSLPAAGQATESATSPAESLHRAVRAGDTAEAARLLAAGVPVDARDRLGSTPLLDASWLGNLPLVQLLLAHAADPSAIHTEAGATPLQYAVLTGHADVVAALLAAHADLNHRYRNGQTITHLAASRGSAAILQLLLHAGAPLDAIDGSGNRPLDEAVLHDHQAAVLALLAHHPQLVNSAAPDRRGPLHLAAVKGAADLVPILLAAGLSPAERDTSGQTPLDLALAYKNLNCVKALLQAGVQLAASENAGAAAMENATLRGQTEVVQALLSAGFNPNQPRPGGLTYLHDAALKGQTAVAALLLKNGAHPEARDSSGETPLHDAALGGSLGVLNLLLDHGAAIDPVDSDSGATPLMLAATLGRAEAVRLLLRRGANPTLRDHHGLTALDRARKAEAAADVIQLLAQKNHA